MGDGKLSYPKSHVNSTIQDRSTTIAQEIVEEIKSHLGELMNENIPNTGDSLLNAKQKAVNYFNEHSINRKDFLLDISYLGFKADLLDPNISAEQLRNKYKKEINFIRHCEENGTQDKNLEMLFETTHYGRYILKVLGFLLQLDFLYTNLPEVKSLPNYTKETILERMRKKDLIGENNVI